ncbi:MAG TPA: UrcA family protein [Phenylobacterium sp.]|jgi:UrcA family protein
MVDFRSLSLVAGALLLAAQPASTQGFALRPGASSDLSDPTKVVRTAVVRLADLDTRSADGAQALLDRIEAAAAAVCGAEDRQCRRMAATGAVARMHSPVLARLAEARPGLAAR